VNPDRGIDLQAAGVIGGILAKRALEKRVEAVHWERKHGQKYHGKIAAVIDSMKAAGLPLN
jgi:ribosomal protein L18